MLMTERKERNQIFLVFDSLRWDVFQAAGIPFLKQLGEWRKAHTPGTYTLPAHMSFFMGKLPHTFDNDDAYYSLSFQTESDGPKRKFRQFWRLDHIESLTPSEHTFQAENIIRGFRNQGYLTVGSGAVNWFNPHLPAGRYLTEPFEKFGFFGAVPGAHADEQLEWTFNAVQRQPRPYFIFINFGETHYPFVYKNCPWGRDDRPYGNSLECRKRQQACLESLEGPIKKFLRELRDYDLVMCADHGEAMGESGLWGHGFYHEKVIEVPLLIKTG